jgi:hypothetical protein
MIACAKCHEPTRQTRCMSIWGDPAGHEASFPLRDESATSANIYQHYLVEFLWASELKNQYAFEAGDQGDWEMWRVDVRPWGTCVEGLLERVAERDGGRPSFLNNMMEKKKKKKKKKKNRATSAPAGGQAGRMSARHHRSNYFQLFDLISSTTSSTTTSTTMPKAPASPPPRLAPTPWPVGCDHWSLRDG